MPKGKCECKTLRREAQWQRRRAERLEVVLRRLVELDDQRRRQSREHGRAVMDARVLLHLGAKDRA